MLRIFTSDEASYNVKAMEYVKSGAIDRFNKLPNSLDVNVFCLIHKLCRTRSAMMAYFDLVSPIFALINLINASSNRQGMRNKLAAYVRKNLRRCAPVVDVAADNFRRWVIQVLLLAWAADGNSGLDPQESPAIAKLLRIVLLCNGDWRIGDAVIHHCNGCCVDDNDCADKIIKAFGALLTDCAWPLPKFQELDELLDCLCKGVFLLCFTPSSVPLWATCVGC